MQDLFDIEIADRPYDPSARQKVVARRRRGDTVLHRVYVFLTGRDLPYVHQVIYHLPSTVTPPPQPVIRSEAVPDCRLVIWVSEPFEVQAEIEDTRGRRYRRQHFLEFERILDEEEGRYIEWDSPLNRP